MKQFEIYKLLFLSLLCLENSHAQTKIDRQALVQRHTIVVTKADSLASLTLGNGGFAFTADITGLQTFPDFYAKGISLGTQSDWHSFPNRGGTKLKKL